MNFETFGNFGQSSKCDIGFALFNLIKVTRINTCMEGDIF